MLYLGFSDGASLPARLTSGRALVVYIFIVLALIAALVAAILGSSDRAGLRGCRNSESRSRFRDINGVAHPADSLA